MSIVSSGSKKSTIRFGLLVSVSRGDQADSSTIRKIKLKEQAGRNLYKQAIDKLQERSDRNLNRINFLLTEKKGYDNFYDAKMALQDHEKKALRIGIDLNSNSTIPGKEVLEKNVLVKIRLDSENSGWHSRGTVSKVVLRVDVDFLPYAIRDVLLDISYGTSILEILDGDTASKRHEFLKEKAVFSKQRGLSTRYGAVFSDDIDYFCFASSCHAGGGIDYEGYEALWTDFLQKYFENVDFTDTRFKGMTPREQVERYHKNSGQFSSAVFEELDGYASQQGAWLLINGGKKPNSRINKSLKSNVFKGAKNTSKINRGTHVIVSFDDYKKYARYWPYVSFFKFTSQGRG